MLDEMAAQLLVFPHYDCHLHYRHNSVISMCSLWLPPFLLSVAFEAFLPRFAGMFVFAMFVRLHRFMFFFL